MFRDVVLRFIKPMTLTMAVQADVVRDGAEKGALAVQWGGRTFIIERENAATALHQLAAMLQEVKP